MRDHNELTEGQRACQPPSSVLECAYTSGVSYDICCREAVSSTSYYVHGAAALVAQQARERRGVRAALLRRRHGARHAADGHGRIARVLAAAAASTAAAVVLAQQMIGQLTAGEVVQECGVRRRSTAQSHLEFEVRVLVKSRTRCERNIRSRERWSD